MQVNMEHIVQNKHEHVPIIITVYRQSFSK